MFCQEYQNHKVLNMATHNNFLAANQWRAFLRAYRNNNIDRILRFSFSGIAKTITEPHAKFQVRICHSCSDKDVTNK